MKQPFIIAVCLRSQKKVAIIAGSIFEPSAVLTWAIAIANGILALLLLWTAGQVWRLRGNLRQWRRELRQVNRQVSTVLAAAPADLQQAADQVSQSRWQYLRLRQLWQQWQLLLKFLGLVQPWVPLFTPPKKSRAAQ
ncbi:hypothetical protein [Synechococcus elongatus]|uniref:Uncharacterized protein n=1 Tax=Synechococcus elongatus PCC 11802 TaxID=2283154 RepID=A0AAT9JY21_SYNEL|nr:hypothetical protein [Synechococcus elongatus]